jgi:hypothetical protein
MTTTQPTRRGEVNARLRELCAVRAALAGDLDGPTFSASTSVSRSRSTGSRRCCGHLDHDPAVDEDLIAARGWQHRAIGEITETPVDQIQTWDADDLDHLNLDHRRQVEAILSVDSTLPWWSRAHA